MEHALTRILLYIVYEVSPLHSQVDSYDVANIKMSQKQSEGKRERDIFRTVQLQPAKIFMNVRR